MAKKGVISKIDYLSTVSGGGYIGSWLATWIKRDGSVTKVSDRLNPEKSPDPFGEEVRPIRWLRMFSNYFTPNASIMSVDAWTVGVTWLRNMLINQLIILLVLLTSLLLGRWLFILWKAITWTDFTPAIPVWGWSLGLLIPVSFLLGLGMSAYYSKSLLTFKKEQTAKVSYAILGIGVLGAFLVSAWLYSRSEFLPYQFAFSDFNQKLNLLIFPILKSP